MSEDYQDLVKNYLENGGKITQGKPMKRTKRISLRGKVGHERWLLEDTYETDDVKKGNIVL
tara:strand:- start:303 stop:485 length:183 start_codon:yes stop_codon:yes gene_type:complete